MRLVDRLTQNSGAKATPEAPAGSLIGGTVVRKRDDIAEGSRRLKIRVHNRLLETLDVSKLDALESGSGSVSLRRLITIAYVTESGTGILPVVCWTVSVQ